MGCEVDVPMTNCSYSSVEVLEMIAFYRSATRVSKLAGRQGFVPARDVAESASQPTNEAASRMSVVGC
jgi:hypothetical protein